MAGEPSPWPTPADPHPAPARPTEPREVPVPEPAGVPVAPDLPLGDEPLGVPPCTPAEIPVSPTMPQPWGRVRCHPSPSPRIGGPFRRDPAAVRSLPPGPRVRRHA